MKTYSFETYLTGVPLVEVKFWYSETTMFRSIDGEVRSVDINADQMDSLHSLQANEQMYAASIFYDAGGRAIDERERTRYRDAEYDYEFEC